ncbi:hypothetical protein RJ640_006327 [Escallonia rubra]|uniref:glutathione transferase n=1 Tax=Escallonia rubra TaxID=112253 RepID=A0AA88RB22_9ASTE|nr:hypothetical protein RJ640_006327 [Escallonia rubra]
MEASGVRLLGAWWSPFLNRVQIALNVKCIDYESIEETLHPKSDFLLKSNPVYKKIPVFFHADKTICESLVILQYIDEVWPHGPSILPSDSHDRATARFWAAYIDDKFFLPLKQLILFARGEEAKKVVQETQEALALLEEAFVKCSKGKAYFGGDSIGYIDITLGSLLGWIEVVEEAANVKFLDQSKTPGLVGWAKKFRLDDAAKEVIPEAEKLKQTYVDEAWTNGPSILPSDPHDRAIARFWAAYIDDNIALNVKCIDYESIEETLHPKSDFLLKSNPVYKKIPVFFHADKTICESLVILQYIDEVWPHGPSILPSDSYDRATARFWAAYIDDKFFLPLKQLILFARGEEAKKVVQETQEALALLEEAFVKCSKGKAYFGGDSIGYIDITLGCLLGWVEVVEEAANVKFLDQSKTPGLVGWAKKFRLDDAAKEVIPEAEKLKQTVKMLQAIYG